MVEYILTDNGTYIKGNNLFNKITNTIKFDFVIKFYNIQ